MTDYTVDEWETKFKPVVNHLRADASWQTEDGDGTGVLFETYGAELEFVLSQPMDRVWTYMDDEEDNLIICAGFTEDLGVIGYFVTEVAREPELEDSSNHICITIASADERE